MFIRVRIQSLSINYHKSHLTLDFGYIYPFSKFGTCVASILKGLFLFVFLLPDDCYTYILSGTMGQNARIENRHRQMQDGACPVLNT